MKVLPTAGAILTFVMGRVTWNPLPEDNYSSVISRLIHVFETCCIHLWVPSSAIGKEQMSSGDAQPSLNVSTLNPNTLQLVGSQWVANSLPVLHHSSSCLPRFQHIRLILPPPHPMLSERLLLLTPYP